MPPENPTPESLGGADASAAGAMPDAFDRLVAVLRTELELLDALQRRLEDERGVLAAGRGTWLPKAASDVEAVLVRIRAAEAERDELVRRIAPEFGLAVDVSLKELAAAAPAPWDARLRDLRASFLSTTAEIEEIAQGNRELLARGATAARSALSLIEGPEPQTYERPRPKGAPPAPGRSSGSTGPRLIDGTA